MSNGQPRTRSGKTGEVERPIVVSQNRTIMMPLWLAITTFMTVLGGAVSIGVSTSERDAQRNANTAALVERKKTDAKILEELKKLNETGTWYAKAILAERMEGIAKDQDEAKETRTRIWGRVSDNADGIRDLSKAVGSTKTLVEELARSFNDLQARVKASGR